MMIRVKSDYRSWERPPNDGKSAHLRQLAVSVRSGIVMPTRNAHLNRERRHGVAL